MPGHDQRIAVLDGFRAVAILAVVIYHYTVRFAAPYSPYYEYPWGRTLYPYGEIFTAVPWIEFGWAGVQLFFIISGFVILMTLQGCASWWEFVVRRFARLWPTMVACTLATASIAWLWGPPEWRPLVVDVPLSMTFVDPALLNKIHPAGHHFVDGAAWSLWVEVRFYALASILFFSVGKHRFLFAWLMLQICVAVLYGFSEGNGPTASILNNFFVARYLPYFTFGCCLFVVYQGKGDQRFAILGAVASAALIFLFSPMQMTMDREISDLARFAVNLVILGAFTIFILRERWLSFFATSVWVKLGAASYSLYLLHQVAGIILIQKLSERLPPLVALVVVFFGVIGASYVLYVFVEQPAKRLILRAWLPSRLPSQPSISGYPTLS